MRTWIASNRSLGRRTTNRRGYIPVRRAENPERKPIPKIEIYQADGIEGFACYLADSGPCGPALVGLNVEAFLGTVVMGHVEASELPYAVAESIMHEVIHVLEEWAGVEFSEDRVEALIAEYRKEAGK